MPYYKLGFMYLECCDFVCIIISVKIPVRLCSIIKKTLRDLCNVFLDSLGEILYSKNPKWSMVACKTENLTVVLNRLVKDDIS